MPNGYEEQARDISSLLGAASRRFGERPFLRGNLPLTYRQADELVDNVASYLSEKGLRQGDRVLIVSGNREEVVLLVFAAARLGAVFSVLSNSIKPFGFRKIFGQVEPAFVALDGPNLSLLPECGKARIISLDESVPSDVGDHFKEMSAPRAGRRFAAPSLIDLDPAALVFTSGSTGEPRGVILSHDNILFTSQAIQQRLGYEATDVVGLYLPLSFDYGLYQIFLAVRAGAELVISSPEDVGPDFVKRLASDRVTVLPGVPAIFSAVCALLKRKPGALASLRVLTNTGEALPRSYVEQLRTLIPGVRVFPMYGLTECKRVSILLPEEMEEKAATVGRPLDNTHAFVVGPDGERLPPGQTGELVIRGRNVCLGYWGCGEETNATFRRDPRTGSINLWTGDLARLDEDGYITFVSRKDSLVKHRGYRINPLEIEAAAYDIPGVREAAAAKLPSVDKLILVISLSDAQLNAQSILLSLKGRLEHFKLPDKVYVVDALPRNHNGKIDRDALPRIAGPEQR